MKKTPVVLIEGDGIGPEITRAVLKILEAAGAPLEWIPAQAGLAAAEACGTPLPDATIDAIRRHALALKGPLTTPVGTGFRSVNVTLRQTFDLYANIRPARSIPGIKTPFDGVDLVIFRENTQGFYIGQEHWINEAHTEAQSTGLVTKVSSDRVIRAAFDYARTKKRKKVTLVHKANILKLTTGLFLDCGRAIAKEYPDISFEDMIVDNTAMQMVINPRHFDIMVTTNLFGDILSDLASGLVGGLGLTGSANLGTHCAIFEAVHGSAPDIAGQGKADPTALLFSALMLLEHIGEGSRAEKIHRAVLHVIATRREACTSDIGGTGSTSEFADAVVAALA